MLEEGSRSPWGKVQQVFNFCEGIQQVSTSSHGGWKVYKGFNKLIPKEFRRAGGWYEEDNEATIPSYFLYKVKGVGNNLGGSRDFYRCYLNRDYPESKKITGTKDSDIWTFYEGPH